MRFYHEADKNSMCYENTHHNRANFSVEGVLYHPYLQKLMNYQCLPFKEAVCAKVVFPEITDVNPVNAQKKNGIRQQILNVEPG